MIAKSRRCPVPDAAEENDRRFVNGCSSSGSPATQPGVTACGVLTLPAHSKLHDVCSPRNKLLDMSISQRAHLVNVCNRQGGAAAITGHTVDHAGVVGWQG